MWVIGGPQEKALAGEICAASPSRCRDLTGADLRNDSGPALNAEGLQVGQDMLLRGFTATGSDFGRPFLRAGGTRQTA